jgi:pimeloyl-ACP methyl ester carboxylesterase
MSGKFAQYIAVVHPERILGLLLIGPVPASEFPVPAEVGKAWCDAQHNRDVAFNQILAPFTKVPVKPELTEMFLDDFAKAARVALEQTLKMCSVSFTEQRTWDGMRFDIPTGRSWMTWKPGGSATETHATLRHPNHHERLWFGLRKQQAPG